VHHPERSAVLLALLIGFASIMSAVIAWRASLASIDASRYESLAVQQQARRLQIERELEGTVEQDLRFVDAYQEHALAARQLQAQADALRPTDPTTADQLDLQAQGELALARSVTPFFLGAGGIHLAEDGSVPYDRAFVLRNLQEGNVELREIRSQRTLELAQAADSRTLSLIAVAALMVAALFFLTVAQVSRSLVRIRQAFFVAGAVLVAVSTLGLLLVEVLA
jgi:uncharacterized membrane protein (DUF2068 family)